MIDVDLLKRYLQKQSSPEEAQQVLKWIQENKLSGQLHDLMKQDWKAEPGEDPDIDFDRQFEKILVGIQVNHISFKEQKRNRILKIAAVFALICCASVVLYYTGGPHGKDNAPLAQTEMSIIKKTKNGEKLTTELPDGTKVILNAGSKLDISPFNDSIRVVTLIGEAFFDVVRDENTPFIVKTQGLETKVLGTSFNVLHEKKKKKTVVSLVSGAVRINPVDNSPGLKPVELTPGFEVVYRVKHQQIEKKKFRYLSRISWKDGNLYFDEANVKDMVRQLEKWYGVTIHLKNSPQKDWRFSGSFNNEPLENVLEGIRFMKGISFRISGKVVEIEFNK
ncbi:MAG: DUF4974 domain-containing protein [Cytophagales bacterium]|nr:DUF4974 domain-containing protein [Cytophagales bacterium]